MSRSLRRRRTRSFQDTVICTIYDAIDLYYYLVLTGFATVCTARLAVLNIELVGFDRSEVP
jgi:hypothetical protein